MSFIVLTKAQAQAVQGLSKEGSALIPVEQADGSFILPDAVLSDPAHQAKWDTLKAYPMTDTPNDKVAADVAVDSA